MMSAEGEEGGAGGELNNVLEEAQALMNEMGGDDGDGGLSETMVIGGFSIDDDDDDDDNARPPERIIDARTKVIGGDPLSTPMSTTTTTTNNNNNNNYTQAMSGGGVVAPAQSPAAVGSAAERRRSSLTLHPLQEEAFRGTATTLTTPSLADVKAKATGFASSMANFAQKAASAAAAAAVATTTPTGGGGSSAMPSNLPPSTTAAIANPRVVVELDKDQKSQLIEEHLGKLLPGEKIIMFLSNLLHVSDSSGFDYASSGMPPTTSSVGNNNAPMWCCCMTFYRVVLFYTAEKSMEPRPKDWNELCWPQHPTQPFYLEMPLASVDRVEKSIYTTAQNTTLMGLVLYG